MKTHARTLAIAIASIAAILGASLQADDLSGLWLGLNTPEIDYSDLNASTKTNAEVRFNDGSGVAYARIGQKYFTQLNQTWSLGTSPAIEFSKSNDDWKRTIRLEIELNPKKIALFQNGPQLDFRNRWELRWKEGEGSEIFHRLRQQTKLIWKLESGPFTSFALGNEIFYETDKERLTTNRFYPIILGANAGPNAKASYFFFYQSKRVGISEEWNGEYILGATLSF